MNDTPTPLFDEVDHDHHHIDIVDPGCGYCASMLRHPAGDNLAAAHEQAQHDRAFETKAQVRVDADDAAFLRHRENLFTVIAVLAFLTAAVLTVTNVDDSTPRYLTAAALTVAAGACAVAAWVLRDHRRGGDPS